jgi:hypothetical protein
LLSSHLPFPFLSSAASASFTTFSLNPKKTALSHAEESGEPLVPSIAVTQMAEMKYFVQGIDDVFGVNCEQREIAVAVQRA